MSFLDDLAAAEAAARPYTEVPVIVGGELHTLRFQQMDPLDWAEETDRHPARPGVMLDKRYGYNLRTLVKAVAPRCGHVVEDGKLVELTYEPAHLDEHGQPVPESGQWVTLLKSLAGHEFQKITNAIWSLNEYLPEEAIKAARKAQSDSETTSS